jgi:branched-chain amino acid transport system ATP-binding protein
VSVLRLENLSRSFGSLVVTQKVSLAIEEGERHVIIGPNGAGKTSLLNQIGGQLRPDSGHIWIKDLEITGWSPERICRCGVARTFQKNSLFPQLSVLENVRLAVQARRAPAWDFWRRADRLSAVVGPAEAALARVGLLEASGRPASLLSYGEQRQLEVALALAGDPDVLLLDEPTSGMSPAETAGMIALIGALPRSLSVLMIEHDMSVVFSLADRITVLYYGEVLASGTPAQIRANARVREVYLGSGLARAI